MNRYPNWDIRLNRYVLEVRDAPFEWGKHDCLSFANGAVAAQTGQGFADEWIGKAKTARDALRLYRGHLESEGLLCGPDALDQWMVRGKGWPSRGNIVARRVQKFATGYALGVCLGDKIAFLGRDCMQFLPMEKEDHSWVV